MILYLYPPASRRNHCSFSPSPNSFYLQIKFLKSSIVSRQPLIDVGPCRSIRHRGKVLRVVETFGLALDDPYGNAIRFHNIWKFDADLATKLASGYTTTTGPLSLSIDDEGDVWTGGTPGLFLTGSSIPRQPIQRFSPDLLTVDHFGSTSAYVFDVFRTYRSWA